MKKSHLKALLERLNDRRVGIAHRVANEICAGASAAVGNQHAARVVDQDADIVALRHRGVEQQHRAEKTDQQNNENRDAEPNQYFSVLRGTLAPHTAVSEQRGNRERGHHEQHQDQRDRCTKCKVTVRKNRGPVLEKELEERAKRVGDQDDTGASSWPVNGGGGAASVSI